MCYFNQNSQRLQAMLTKIIIIAVMFTILIALGSSLMFLIRDDGKDKRVVKALTVRIGLSLVLFLFLFIAFGLGWIHPHAV